MKHPLRFPIKLLGSVALIALIGCAMGPRARVIENEDGSLSAISAASTEPDARIGAIDAADRYCGGIKRRPIVRGSTALRDQARDQVTLFFHCQA